MNFEAIEEPFEGGFKPQDYVGRVVDVVHISSLERVASGQKPADQSDRNMAEVVLRRIEELKKMGVVIREIDNLAQWRNPSEVIINDDSPLVLGGAFVGQCLADYEKPLERQIFLLS